MSSYIFGGNEKDQEIAMTSPVKMDIENSYIFRLIGCTFKGSRNQAC
ncbi:MAG: heme-binding protein [Bacteroidetes bacterium]|nr:heme-binding protein [Bacteroidota bacterium]